MNKQMAEYSDKINALSMRERLLILTSVVAVLFFLWWHFYAQSLSVKTKNLKNQNITLEQEIKTLQLTTQAIDQRIKVGVNEAKNKQLESLKDELSRVNLLLKQKTLELIEPDEMFQLMQQLIFADSKLKLTGLKRKQVKPAFSVEEKDSDQPEIYRHVMQVKFEGSYQNVLSYIDRMEDIEWKLIWDSITLKTADYPVIEVEIDISTLSDNEHWVGL